VSTLLHGWKAVGSSSPDVRRCASSLIDAPAGHDQAKKPGSEERRCRGTGAWARSAGAAILRSTRFGDVVYHLSANTENRSDRADNFADYRLTVGGTVNVLESEGYSKVRLARVGRRSARAPDPRRTDVTLGRSTRRRATAGGGLDE